ncbi:ferrous iron transporter B [Pseudomonas sp. SDI]|uniref:fimbria/pilus outer membrane usher protein n=1 Tax=Pseudomonas sp. SDI TaxID=2170734 RepID=UPI000DE7B2FE|nr:fimbria/pilus outer membrane usher protein [Pseudomonas sp. SDI]PWB30717.1 ferrous iron transporter B [Pseudomonas sp. SDI]
MYLPLHWRTPLARRLSSLFTLSGCCLAVLASMTARAEEVVAFQSGFMRQLGGHGGDANALALKALVSNELAPGRYAVSIEINSTFFDRRELEFSIDAQGELLPCLSLKLVEALGVKLDSLPGPLPAPEAAGCVNLQSLIPEARIELNASRMQLSISVPQILMRRDSTGYTDPAQWDDGINSAFINYQVAGQQSRHDQGGSSSSQYLYLTSGLNLGAWRLRSSNAFQNDGQGRQEWSRAYTYVQRDLPGTLAQLTLGETSTPGDIFRSLPITGAQVASDMNMLPDALRNYAPVVRGVAMSRARLDIRQNGFPIYSTYVSAGPYEIDDLSAVSGSGELEIIQTESDGQVRRFTQPYSTMSNLLRDGVWRYTASVGRYNAPGDSASDAGSPLFQGTLARGIGWNSTLYGGLMSNDFYQAGALGITKNLGSFGALSVDATRSVADIGLGETRRQVRGMSYAAKYSKSFDTRTSVRFAGYRYSTEGYRDFSEALRERNSEQGLLGSRRSRLEASVSQSIGKQSSLNLSLSQQDYWNSDYQQRQFQVNFATSFKSVNVNLYASQSLNDDFGSDRQIGLSVSMPFEFGRSTRATYDLQQNKNQVSQRAALSGVTEAGRLSYRASLADNGRQQKTGELSLGYQAPFASIGAGVSQGSDFRSVSLNASGAVLLHSEGAVFGTYVGETSGLAHVPQVKGVGLVNADSNKTNQGGYALIPYLQPYRINRVMLDIAELEPNVEIENGATQVVPRRGAIVKASFPARRVERLFLTIRTADGVPLPFGAQISNSADTNVGVVGQAGQALLGTEGDQQTLNVRWGDTAAEQCQLKFDVQKMPEEEGYRVQDLICR